MKKIWGTILLLMILCGILSACTNPITTHTSTPMSAAKAFVAALTSGNMVKLNQVVYHSQSMPTDEIMRIAKMRKITKMSPQKFSYKIDPNDKETVDVSFKDENGIEDTWKLVFLKNEAGNYQYDGHLSGTLFANTTPEEAMKSYIQILIHASDPYWYNNLKDQPLNFVPSINQLPDSGMVQKYKLYNKNVNDFKISNIRVFDNGNEAEIHIQFSYKGQWYETSYMFNDKGDGFGLVGTGAIIKVTKTNSDDYQAGTPLKAAKSFVQGICYGSMPQNAIQQKANLKEILTIADSRNITGMKTKAFKLKDEGNGTVSVSFVPKSGEQDTLQLTFVISKSGNYQFDGDQYGTLLANSSPQEAAESYVKALIGNANAFELKSLTVPSKRSSYSNKDASNLVNKYQLQKKKLSDFKITTSNNKVTIQFTDSAGKAHSIHLTTEKWKDGYYVVSDQVE